VISDPLKAEPFKLIQLLLGQWLRGMIFRIVAAFNPIQQMPLNLLNAEVGALLLDVLNALLKIEPSRIRPDKLALLDVDLNVIHQI
jgi:hypothetical protein